MTISLTEIARAMRGHVAGLQVLAPGPGHSQHDRSLLIQLSDTRVNGYRVHSFAGDDWRICRDYVADRLGLPRDRWRERRELDPVLIERRRGAHQRAAANEVAKGARRRRRAVEIWRESQDPVGTVVECYLNGRGLALPPEVAGSVIRFHPLCPWGNGCTLAMVAAMRCIRSGKVLAIHRTALTTDGSKIDRAMLAPSAGTAVMLDPEEEVTMGLAIGEGIESVLAARQLGIRPAWALGSKGPVERFPVLAGIDALTLLVENDANGASDRACNETAMRWYQAGRVVDLVRPPPGLKDLNDLIREVAPA